MSTSQSKKYVDETREELLGLAHVRWRQPPVWRAGRSGGLGRRRQLLWAAAAVRAVEERRKKVNAASTMRIKSLMSDGLLDDRQTYITLCPMVRLTAVECRLLYPTAVWNRQI